MFHGGREKKKREGKGGHWQHGEGRDSWQQGDREGRKRGEMERKELCV